MFGRLLGISLDQNLDMRNVLTFPLTAFPACFAHPDGTMTKTDKAALGKAILGKATWAPPSNVDYTLVDGLQKRAFEWPKELRNVNFKIEIVKFLTQEWEKDEYAVILGTRKISINFETCIEFSAVEGKVERTMIPHLSCPDHEEADTKLVFHACQTPPSSIVIIRCSDTDVSIIMLGNMAHLKDGVQVWFDFGTGNARKTINVTDVRASLGDLCDALPGIHAFTGNDYNPCFYGIGRTKPLKILTDISKNDPTYMHAFTALGDDEIPQGLESIIENFTCHLYSVNNRVLQSVDEVRYAMFKQAYKCERIEETFLRIKYKFDSARLPPCQTEFTQHFHGKYFMNWFEGDQVPEQVANVLSAEKLAETMPNEETTNENALDEDVQGKN
ncbi:hypothetical protein QAD02_012722 [Eretmocerus hayati]|uniref:Uncharacterized protein n=1 Tax=Eretmocerus hayati TaxID=131215 RepID=A0ACC2P596_9HYME|nr:hypothetical protein QAD02_012722 [Eretmocerus hayati]